MGNRKLTLPWAPLSKNCRKTQFAIYTHFDLNVNIEERNLKPSSPFLKFRYSLKKPLVLKLFFKETFYLYGNLADNFSESRNISVKSEIVEKTLLNT
jgi:hypothetical protein